MNDDDTIDNPTPSRSPGALGLHQQIVGRALREKPETATLLDLPEREQPETVLFDDRLKPKPLPPLIEGAGGKQLKELAAREHAQANRFVAALAAEINWATETHPPFPSAEHGLHLIDRARARLAKEIENGTVQGARKVALELATLVVRLGEDHLTPKDA
jgi:hypothetical protein